MYKGIPLWTDSKWCMCACTHVQQTIYWVGCRLNWQFPPIPGNSCTHPSCRLTWLFQWLPSSCCNHQPMSFLGNILWWSVGCSGNREAGRVQLTENFVWLIDMRAIAQQSVCVFHALCKEYLISVSVASSSLPTTVSSILLTYLLYGLTICTAMPESASGSGISLQPYLYGQFH